MNGLSATGSPLPSWTHLGHGHSRTSAHNCAIGHSVFPEPRGCILSSEHVERRLAAILAADVAGSCRLIGIDEEGTVAQLRALRKALFDPKSLSITDVSSRIPGTALSLSSGAS